MSKKTKVKVPKKVETVEEFLARGGTITQVPQQPLEPQVSVVRTASAGGPVTLMTLEEADLFHGEARKNSKAKKPKPSVKIDLDALPPALKAKFLAKLKEEVDGEDYQEELDEADESDED